MHDGDTHLIWENYLLLELKNSKRVRAQFAQKYGVDEDKAGKYIEDFIEIQDKIQDKDRRDPLGKTYQTLDDLESVIKRYQGDTSRARKKDKLIEWARNHPQKITENEKGIAVKIDKHEDSRVFSQLTNWCTTTKCAKNWDKYQDQNVSFVYVINFAPGAANSGSIGTGVGRIDIASSSSDFFAIAIYDKTWNDLHEITHEVATLPLDDDDVAYAPMAAAYGDLGGNIDVWVDYLAERWAENNNVPHAVFNEEWGDIEMEFAKDFIDRWDQVTGGAPAMEAFSEDDTSVSPIAVINHFNIPNILGELRKYTSVEKTFDEILNSKLEQASHSIPAMIRLWRDKYAKTDGDRMIPPDPSTYSPPARALVRWPEMEKNIIQKLREPLTAANPVGVSDTWTVFQRHLMPYIHQAIGYSGQWGALERYFWDFGLASFRNFNELHDALMSNKIPADKIIPSVYRGSALAKRYNEVFPYIMTYYTKININDISRSYEVLKVRMTDTVQMVEEIRSYVSRIDGVDDEKIRYGLPNFSRFDVSSL